MIEQIVPLGELGVLMAIYQRLGSLRQDTDKNGERIARLKKRLKALEQRLQRRPQKAD